jgi:hypothetical protein
MVSRPFFSLEAAAGLAAGGISCLFKTYRPFAAALACIPSLQG